MVLLWIMCISDVVIPATTFVYTPWKKPLQYVSILIQICVKETVRIIILSTRYLHLHTVHILGYRLMVGQQFLELLIEVRALVPQQHTFIAREAFLHFVLLGYRK